MAFTSTIDPFHRLFFRYVHAPPFRSKVLWLSISNPSLNHHHRRSYLGKICSSSFHDSCVDCLSCLFAFLLNLEIYNLQGIQHYIHGQWISTIFNSCLTSWYVSGNEFKRITAWFSSDIFSSILLSLYLDSSYIQRTFPLDIIYLARTLSSKDFLVFSTTSL